MTEFEQRLKDDDVYAAEYAQESFVIDVMEEISRFMTVVGVNKAELARRMGTSRANVTQMLNGRNVGLRTLAEAAHAMGATPEFALRSTRTVHAHATDDNVVSFPGTIPCRHQTSTIAQSNEQNFRLKEAL